MAEQETIFVRGEGGSIFELGLPLHETMADKLTSGLIRRVNADGSNYEGSVDGVPAPSTERPAQSAVKADWVVWAVQRGMKQEDADSATKQDLIDRYGRD